MNAYARITHETEILKTMCDAVGAVCNLSASKSSYMYSHVTTMELLFADIDMLTPLCCFANLRSLTIIGLELINLNGIQTLEHLVQLTAVECHLKKIEYLDQSTKLRSLFLYCNQIEKIEGLNSCRYLEVLWLSGNRISTIEGLQSLTHLKELNLADNFIGQVGSSLDRNNRLESLNLSGNNLFSLKDVSCLIYLPRLKLLSFGDPRYIPCPLCQLCNYTTCAVYHFTKLMRLDGQLLSDYEIKKELETICLKKLYYTMKLETMKLKELETKRQLWDVMTEIEQKIISKLRNVQYTRKELERYHSQHKLCETSNKLSPPDTNSNMSKSEGSEKSQLLYADEDDYSYKLFVLSSKVDSLNQKFNRFEDLYADALKDLRQEVEVAMKLVTLEHETLGCARFQNGEESDQWWQACRDLLLSRFCANHYAEMGIVGMRVRSIVKVTNESLSLRFQEKIAADYSVIDEPIEASLPHKIIILFLIRENRENIDEFLDLLSNGFTVNQQDSNKNKIHLTNSMHRVDQNYLEASLLAREDLKGTVLMVKTYTGRVCESTLQDNSITKRAFPDYDTVCRKTFNVMSKNAPSNSLTCSKCDVCTPKCSDYFVFEEDHVIPEYIVNYEYVLENPVESPFSDMMIKKKFIAPTINFEDQTAEIEILAPPHFNVVHQLSWEDLVKKMCTKYLGQVEEINLHCNQIITLPDMSSLKKLKRLTLSFNCLSNLRGVNDLPNLEYLDASFNKLIHLEGLMSVPKLGTLDVGYNQLRKAEDLVSYIEKHAPSLFDVSIIYNPWPQDSDIIQKLKSSQLHLAVINGKAVNRLSSLISDSTSTQFPEDCFEIEFIRLHASTIRRPPPSLSLKTVAKRLLPLHLKGAILQDRSCFSKITAVDLSNLMRSKFPGISELENLRWVDLSQNGLCNIGDLIQCSKLEELCLEHNHITTLSGISELRDLVNLNVNYNQLESLNGWEIDRLQFLQSLHASYNHIPSLKGLEECPCLTELYLINNQIRTVGALSAAKCLQTLLVVMLNGNPVANDCDDYRHVMLFNLPGLLGLDGRLVDASEINIAKEVLGGRLNIEFIRDQIGSISFASLVHLDLPSVSIQSVNMGNGSELPNLKSINLERNLLSSFSGLIHLHNLKVLCLNYNHIEELVKGKQSDDNFEADTRSQDFQVMKKLEVLHLGYNDILNLEPLLLHRFPSLKALFLQGNRITSLTGLEGLWYLEHLVLDRNHISLIAKGQLEALCWLQELHMQENRLKELPELYGPSGLLRMFLGSNRIKDLEELFKLSKLPCLEEISFVGNPVTRRAMHRPILINFLSTLTVVDGIDVTWEERTRATNYFNEKLNRTECGDASQEQNEGETNTKSPKPSEIQNMHGMDNLKHGTATNSV